MKCMSLSLSLLVMLLLVPSYHRRLDTLLPFVAIATCSTSATTSIGKVKVFILAGQSNMVGFGSIRHLDLLVESGNSTEDYDVTTGASNKVRSEIRNSVWSDTTKNYSIRDDVYLKFNVSHGYLTVHRASGYAHRNHFGPELMFGYTIGDAILSVSPMAKNADTNATDSTEEQPNRNRPRVLLIKTAYSGQSLAVDFRPPSAAMGQYRGVDKARYGTVYRTMMADINNALIHINEYVPHYNESVGYEISGFVWFHGYKDSTNIDMVNEYQANLIHFIRDVRKDLNTSTLPFVVGELGMHGRNLSIYSTEEADRVSKMRQAERNVCNLLEFKNNTRFASTAQYSIQMVSSNNTGTDNDVTSVTTYNNLKHYYGRADTIYYIGRELGRSMIPLINLDDDTNTNGSSDDFLAPTMSPSTKLPVVVTRIVDFIRTFWDYLLRRLNIY